MYCGGEGVVRETLFRKPLTLSVLTERRVFNPYGLNGVYMFVCLSVMVMAPHFTGGSDGKKGRNILISAVDKTERDLGPKSSVHVEPGVSGSLHGNPMITVPMSPLFTITLFVSLPQDIFHLETPGGGGYGDPKMKFVAQPPASKKQRVYPARGSLATYKQTQESA